MMFRRRPRVSRLLVKVQWDSGLAQVQVMQAIQVQTLRPPRRRLRLTQGIIRVTPSLHATGQALRLRRTGPCGPRPAQGPLASDAACGHTVRSHSHDPNVMIISWPGVPVLRASQARCPSQWLRASESLVRGTVLRNEAVRASSQAGGSCLVD
jgi:hypothetical protein